MTQEILITGMSGLIGTATRRRLEPRARLTALNRSDVPGVETVRADLSDLDAIRPAFEGRDTVVHLAAKAGDQYSWEELRYDIFFINSDNRWSYRDLSHAREVLGFAPRDGAGDCRG